MGSIRDRILAKEEEEKKNGARSSGTSIRDRLMTGDKVNEVGKTIQDRLNTWLTNSKDYVTSSANRYKNYDTSTYRKEESTAWKNQVTSQRDWFAQEAENINNLIAKYEKYLDKDWVSEVRMTMANVSKEQDNVLYYADEDLNHWSQWDSEAHYNYDYDNYTYGTKYEGKTYADIQKALESAEGREKDWLTSNAEYYMGSADAQSEIDKLNEEIKKLNNEENEIAWGYNPKGKTMEEIQAERNALQSRISTLKGIRDTAKRTEALKEFEKISPDAMEWYENLEGDRDPLSSLRPMRDPIKKPGDFGYSNTERYDFNQGNKGQVVLPAVEGVRNSEHMTHLQRVMYYYLKEHPEAGDADEYIDALQVQLDKAENDAQNKKYADMLDNGNFLEKAGLQVASIGGNIFGGVPALLDNAYNTITGKPINPYSPAYAMQNMANTVRTETAQNIEEKARWELGGYNVASSLYSFGMSAIDSTVGGYALGPAYLYLAGSNAAASKMKELYERGASNEQVLIGGTLSGLAEAVFEKIGLDNLLSPKASANFGQWLLEVAKQAGIEGLEEGLTESANIFFDEVIMGDKSNLSLAIKKYETGYYDENGEWHDPIGTAEATKKAYTEALGEVLYATVGGMVSGGMSAGPVVGVQTIANANAMKNTGKDILATNGGYNALKNLATEVSSEGLVKNEANIKKLVDKTQKDVDAYNKGKASKHQANKTTKNVGKLSQAVDSVRNEQNLAEIRSSLESKGLSKSKAQKAAELLNEALYSDGAYSKELYKSVMNDEGVWDTLRELVSSPESTLQSRNLKHKLGRVGLKVGKDGTIVSSVDAESTGSKYVDESLSFVEDASKREYKASTEGKSIVTSTGETIDIVEVASIENGQMMLKVKDVDGGESVVNARDVSYSSESEALVYEAVVNMGLNAVSANSIIKSYNPTQDAGAFARGVQEAYRYGKYNYSEFEMYQDGNFLTELSEAQIQKAYKLGQIQSGSDTAVAVAKLKEAIANSKGKKGEGKVHFEGDAVNIDVESLKDQQKVSLKTMEMLSKALGIEFYVYSSYTNAKGERVYKDANGNVKPAPNGVYDKATGAIHIDLNAGETGEGTMLFTIAHELTHFIKAWSPAKFKVLANFLVEQYGKKGVSVEVLVRRQMANMKANGRKNVTYDKAFEEFVADSMQTMLTSGNVVNDLAEIKRRDEGLWNKIKEFFTDFVDNLKKTVEAYSGFAPDTIEGQTVAEMTDAIERLEKLFTEALVDASENFRAISFTEQQTLAEVGIGFDEDTRSVHSLRYSTGRKDALGNVIDLVTVGKKNFNTEAIAQLVAKGTGRSIEDARKWVNSEITIANIVMNNPEFLDFEADDRYEAIKKNSDYPQGTVDLSNLCPKRTEFTAMFDMLQRKYPDKLFTANDVAAMRNILKEKGITVACGACFVEDRRQLLGEIADTYIGMWKEAVETGKPLQKTNASGNKVTLTVTKALAKQYGLKQGSEILATDKYIPTQYDLTTYEGFKLLEKNHPTIAMGFNRYNNSRGQQAGRLIEGRAEYNRQILGWSPAKVKSVNNNGGLRIFSFSDFEVVHLLDLVQVIIDCSAMGVKIQGYTKIPSFARLIRNTGIKINRSLIPKGQTGMKMVNGKQVLDYDTTEGIDINDENFIDERNNPNVGNILIGINPTQIGLAMLDDFVDYIIPFHTNKSKDICKALGLAEWVNYKESQHEKDIDTGKASKHNVNIYTQVINKYNPTNKVEFVDAFLKVCKAQKKIPRYSEFLNKEYKADGAYTDEYGTFDFTYREGYHKLIVDFKMFDRNGNILPQGEITPNLEESFMKKLLKAEVDKKQNYEFPQEVYDRLDKEFGEDGVLYSDRKVAPGMTDTERYEVLKGRSLFSIPSTAAIPEPVLNKIPEISSWEDINNYLGSKKKEIIRKLTKEFNMLSREYFNEDTDLHFAFSRNNFDETYDKQKQNYVEFAKMLSVLDRVIESAIGVEIHNRTDYKPDPTLDNVFVLMSAFEDGKFIIPVKLEVKKFKDKQNTLYVAISLNKIEKTEVYGQGNTIDGVTQSPRSVNVSVSRIFSKINPSDKNFLKYLPDGFLNDAQRVTKQEALIEDADNAYKSAIKRNDMQAVQRMVEDAAKRAGYTERLLHGTQKFGFTVTDTSLSDDKLSFFATSDVDTAKTYSSLGGTRGIGEDANYDAIDEEFAKHEDNAREKASDLADKISRWAGYYGYIESNYIHDTFKEIADDYENGRISQDTAYQRMYEFADDAIANGYDRDTYDGQEFWEWQESEESEQLYTEVNKTISAYLSLADFGRNADRSGNYDLYANTEGLLIIEGNGAKWNNIKSELLPDITSDKYKKYGYRGHWDKWTTRSISKYASDNGYRGVLFKNIYDDGGKSSTGVSKPADVYSFFYPQEQVKSADPVTYDENGNVIPLSERFNPDNDDLRYSLRNKDSKGNTLSKEQTEYFKDSKVRDKNGNLLVVYHGTPKNFTVFRQGVASGWGKGIYFTDNRENAVEYGDNIVEAYLNITNPYYADKESYNDIGAENTKAYRDFDMKVWKERYDEYDTYEEYVADGMGVDMYEIYTEEIEVFNKILRELGYDGIIADGSNNIDGLEIVAFNESQPKLTTNSNPTSDPDIRYSDRNKDSVSNRSLLANALESAVTNEFERKTLNDYKEELGRADALEKELGEIRSKIRELSFAKGPKDTEEINKLREQEVKTVNRIDIRDKKLLRLEATKPLKDIIHRERDKAYKRAEKEGKEALARHREKTAETQREMLSRWQESRHKAVEGRNKTAMRHKIKGVVSELNKLLLHGTKDNHVMIGLQKAVASALDAVNMDTVGADERVAKYNDLIAKAKDPDVIESLTATRDRILAQGDKIGERLANLKNAYSEIKNSDDPLIANSYDEVISSKMEAVVQSVGDTSLRDMSLSQLEDVYDLYKMVFTTIRNSNKAFKAKKGEEISVLGNRVMEEVESAGGKKDKSLKLLDGVKQYGWSILKPVYAFKLIGSNTFSEVYDNVRKGEDTWARDIDGAIDFRTTTQKKYNYKKWDFHKKHKFTAKSGVTFELTLEQMLSLYAYSKRKQADDHLEKGGFVFDTAIEVIEKKHGIPLKYNVNTATAHQLSKETLADIIGNLTEEQKGFVDEMQDYLSTVMGEKGNEVSLEMYGVKLFKEKFYFPLKSARQFLFEQNEVAGEVKIKNSGFSKETVAHANNPIILDNFLDVWANHVNDMSMYHSFVLPLEDFNRVYNYKTPTTDNMQTESVKMYLQNAYGTQASSYIKQLLTDLNGGARSDPQAGIFNKALGKFKKAKVFASMSVVIQQPSAIGRAFAYIDPKYFVGKKVSKSEQMKTWSEVKKYAPVAIIKEMGYFDVGNGRSTVSFLKGDKSIMDRVDDVASWLPAKADEITWCAIWEAVKRETADNNKELKADSEALLKAAGERFTEVIVNTQVYDSVLSRSGMMRSKDTLVKMATAFMAEPTTTMNMMVEATLEGKRGNKKVASKLGGGAVASILLNSILVAFVYAARDDDEDETYAEKYLGSLTAELMDGFNPLTYLPIVKDLWSIGQGFDVERSDVSLFADLIDSFKNLFNEDASALDKVMSFTGDVTNLFGLPFKNVWRDVEALYNVAKGIIDGTQTTTAGIGYSVMDSVRNTVPVWGWIDKGSSKGDKLYNALVSGDQVQIDRIKGGYEDDKAYENAVKQAIRENDKDVKNQVKAFLSGDFTGVRSAVETIASRYGISEELADEIIDAEYTYYKNKIADAAEALNEGKTSEYKDIVKTLRERYRGVYTQDEIVNAIKKKAEEPKDDSPEIEEGESVYDTWQVNSALESGDIDTATAMIEDIVRVKTENNFAKAKAEAEKNGKKFNEKTALKEAESKAKSSVKSSITSHWKPLYKQAYKNKDTEEMKRIREMLLATSVYGRASDVLETVKGWLKS